MQDHLQAQRDKEEANFKETGKREIMITRREVKELRVAH